MAWQITPYTPLLALSVLVSTAVTGYLLSVTTRQERDCVVVGLLAMLVGAAWWSLTDLYQLSQTTVAAKEFAERLEFVGGIPLVLGWFVFAFAYTDREEWVTRRVVGTLGALLGAGTLVVLTNPLHELMWTDARLVDGGPVQLLSVARQPPYVAYVAITYLVILVGIYVLVRFVLASKDVYRGQALALVVATVVPTATSVASQLSIGPAVDVTPMAFTVSGVALVFAITRYRLLDLEPIARRRVVENMRDGYLVLDEADRIVDLNPSAAQLLDRDDGVVGTAVQRHLPDAPDLFDDASHTQTELVFDRGDSTQYVEAHLSPLADADDHLGRLLTLRDITDRRGIENRYRTLIENSSDLIVVLGATGSVTYVSPSVEHVLELSPDDVVGMDVFEFVHPEDHDRLYEAFEAGLTHPDEPHRFEYRVQHGDGHWCVLEGIARNLLDNPFVEGVVVNARDITARKERERELERQNEQLDQFAGVVSHDLRNPLEIARGRLELARERGADADFEAVERAHDRMDTIIDDLLTLARQGQTVGETTSVSIDAVATEAWETVDTGAVTLAVADDSVVPADRTRLTQLFENLFRNAVEHGSTGNRTQSDDAVEHGTTDGHRDETAAASRQDGGSEHTVTVGALPEREGFYVEDDGPGIPAEQREQVFEFGYTDSEDGTGMGLAIVERIAEAHGWQVTATEGSSGGARFEFTGVDPVEHSE